MSSVGDLAPPTTAPKPAAADLAHHRRANENAYNLPPTRRRTRTLKPIAPPNSTHALDPRGTENSGTDCS